MPIKRRNATPRRAGLTPSEREWLTGRPQPGSAFRFWRFKLSAERLERCRQLLREHANLIPPGRLPVLEADVRELEYLLGDRAKG